MLKIEMNTMDLHELEAKGVVAMLVAIYGDQIMPSGLTVSSKVGVSSPDAAKVTEYIKSSEAGELAPDGYNEPNPAAVFGAAPPPPVNIPADTTAGDLDTAGIPWNEKIHASTKTTNKDGTWSRRRNTPDELYNSVMAELRAQSKAPASATAPPPPVVAAPPAPPAPTPTPQAPSTAGQPTFITVLKRITEAQKSGLITWDEIKEFCAMCGVENPPKLNGNPEACATFDALLDSKLGPAA